MASPVESIGKPKSDQPPGIMAEHAIVDTLLVILRETVSDLDSQPTRRLARVNDT